MFRLEQHQLQYALLTILLELPIFWLCGYRKIILLSGFAAANFVSNLLLNEALPAYEPTLSYWLQLAVGELLVVLLEYTLLRFMVQEEKPKLMVTVLLTNAFSLGVGLLMM